MCKVPEGPSLLGQKRANNAQFEYGRYFASGKDGSPTCHMSTEGRGNSDIPLFQGANSRDQLPERANVHAAIIPRLGQKGRRLNMIRNPVAVREDAPSRLRD